MALEQHQVILDLVAAGESLETIASRLGRSIETVRRVVEKRQANPVDSVQAEQNSDLIAGIDLDEVVDFLSSIPEEGLKEVGALATLQRQAWRLKSQLLARLAENGRRG